MDILFLSIVERLKARVPELLWIDWEEGQLDIPEESNPVQFPAVLIEMPSIQWNDVGNKLQTGDVVIQVKVVFDIYQELHVAGGVSSPDQRQALEQLRLLNKIHAALHGFGGHIIPVVGGTGFIDNHFNRLMRTRTTIEKPIDGLKEFVLTYECNMRDNYAMDQMRETAITDIAINQPGN